jgi:hypothetical protein
VYSFAVNALNSPPTASRATEMRAPVQRRGLVAGPDPDPHADAGGADAGHLLGDDPQPAGQDGAADPRRHLSGVVALGEQRPGGPDSLWN